MISTSILSIKDNLDDNIIKIDNTTTDYIHLDIMDGIFVPNKTDDISPLLYKIKKPLDIHLMVSDVKEYVNNLKNLNPQYITFQVEIKDNILELINYIKSFDIKVGISIKPDTKVEEIYEYLPYVDLVLVMTVEPGKGGQKFMSEMCLKTDILRKLQVKYNFKIEVDGGINNETIKQIDSDIYVVGSYITNSDDYQKQINSLD